MSDFITRRFRRAFDLLLGLEGGYVNDPRDRGGETKYGISARSYPDIPIAEITPEMAAAIYLRDYWRPLRCDDFAAEPVAVAVFLFGVNAGQRTAAKAIQVALNGIGRPLPVDGNIGPATLAAANAVEGGKMLAAFNGEARRHYLGIVERRPEQAAFLPGWLARLEAA